MKQLAILRRDELSPSSWEALRYRSYFPSSSGELGYVILSKNKEGYSLVNIEKFLSAYARFQLKDVSLPDGKAIRLYRKKAVKKSEVEAFDGFLKLKKKYGSFLTSEEVAPVLLDVSKLLRSIARLHRRFVASGSIYPDQQSPLETMKTLFFILDHEFGPQIYDVVQVGTSTFRHCRTDVTDLDFVVITKDADSVKGVEEFLEGVKKIARFPLDSVVISRDELKKFSPHRRRICLIFQIYLHFHSLKGRSYEHLYDHDLIHLSNYYVNLKTLEEIEAQRSFGIDRRLKKFISYLELNGLKDFKEKIRAIDYEKDFANSRFGKRIIAEKKLSRPIRQDIRRFLAELLPEITKKIVQYDKITLDKHLRRSYSSGKKKVRYSELYLDEVTKMLSLR